MVTAILILVALALAYLAIRQRRELDAGNDLRADLVRQLDDARDERDGYLDELDRAELRLTALELRARTAETALAYKTLVSEGVTSLDAARLARAR